MIAGLPWAMWLLLLLALAFLLIVSILMLHRRDPPDEGSPDEGDGGAEPEPTPRGPTAGAAVEP